MGRSAPCVALVLALFLAPAFARAADPVPRVAVICIGDDPSTTGACQRELESRFVAPEFALRDAPDLAASIASRAPAPDRSDPTERKRAAEMLEAGAKAYYDDKLVDALDKLAAVQALHERASGISTEERIKLLLWRTAVFLALGDRPKAEGEARAALILSPALDVDLQVFRPSVKTLIDEIRAAGLPTATVLFSGMPPGAEVKIDGRVVSERAQVPLGRHRLVARAPGFLEVDRSIDVTSDSSIPLAMPLSLDPALETALEGVVEKGEASPEAKRTLERVAEKARVDAVVITTIRVRAAPAESRSFVYWRSNLAPPASGPRISSRPSDALRALTDAGAGPHGGTSISAIADLAYSRVESTAPTAIASLRKSGGPSPTPLPARTPVRPTAPTAPPPPIALAARGDMAVVQRERAVEGSSGAGYSSGFVGVGPRVAVDVSRASLVGLAEAAFVTYSMSTLDVNVPGGGRRTVTGGSTLAFRTDVGWAQRVTSTIDVTGLGGLAWEKHEGDDVRAGEALGIFPSEQRLAFELQAIARAKVAASATVSAGLGVSPWSRWSETPSETTGSAPKTAIDPSWRLGVAVPLRAWEAGLSYEGELRSASLSGTASAPVDPPLRDATVRQTLHTVAVTIRRRL